MRGYNRFYIGSMCETRHKVARWKQRQKIEVEHLDLHLRRSLANEASCLYADKIRANIKRARNNAVAWTCRKIALQIIYDLYS